MLAQLDLPKSPLANRLTEFVAGQHAGGDVGG